MTEFVAEYVSEKALGEDGYLADKGLVTLPGDQAARRSKRHGRWTWWSSPLTDVK